MNPTTTQEGTMQVEGFSNYATFGIAVTLGNDQTAMSKIAEYMNVARESAQNDSTVLDGIWTEAQAIRFRFADWLKDYAERLNDDGIARNGSIAALVSSQMAQAGLAEVDWHELADHWNEYA